MSSPACKVDDVLSLIPQRPPIQMVDGFTFEDEQNCCSTLALRDDNMFLDESGQLAEEGILEHIAQTAAAYVGFLRKRAGEAVNMGYIGDIKRCTMNHPMPMAGSVLETRLVIVSQVGNITMISAETTVDSRTLLTCRMKLAN